MKIHPAADLFPMMSDEELNELAADIQANGLIYPIIVDDEEQVVDGRNRLAACKICGVKPTFEKLNGQDPLAYIISANIHRRTLSKGQQAMAYAMIYPEPEKGGRGKKAPETSGFSRQRVGVARSVLRHSRKLAEAVLRGPTSLDQALEEVHVEEDRIATAEDRMKRLRANAPDLADLFDEGRIELKEAYAAMERRITDAEQIEANKRETIIRLSESAWQSTTAWAADGFLLEVTKRLADDSFRKQWMERVRLDYARLPDVLRGARVFSGLLEEIENVRPDQDHKQQAKAVSK